MSRVWSVVKLLAVLAAVGGLLFAGAALLLTPDGHGGGSVITDNPASRAIRNVFDDDDAVINGVQAAHAEFNEEVWGDGGNLTTACSELEEALTVAGEGDVYDDEQTEQLDRVTRRVCDGDGKALELHDALVDVEEALRAAAP